MKRSKLFVILVLLMIFILFIPTCLNSVEASAKIDNTIISDSSPSGEFKDIGNKIFGAIQTVGVAISVIVLTVMGIKYMVGSVEEKATYKESMKPYIIGICFLALASVIPNFIYNLDLF